CGYISRKKMTTGPLAMLAKRLFRQRGENYHYAETFVHTACNNFITPKLPQIRPGRDPYLIRLFSRLPHLMRFLSLDVLLKKLYETYYQISHTFCYLWLEL